MWNRKTKQEPIGWLLKQCACIGSKLKLWFWKGSGSKNPSTVKVKFHSVRSQVGGVLEFGPSFRIHSTSCEVRLSNTTSPLPNHTSLLSLPQWSRHGACLHSHKQTRPNHPYTQFHHTHYQHTCKTYFGPHRWFGLQNSLGPRAFCLWCQKAHYTLTNQWELWVTLSQTSD